MLNSLYGIVNRFVTKRSVILCGVFFLLLLFLINGKPFGVAELKEHSNGVGILDLEKYYSPEYAYQLLDAQGEVGRELYKNLIIRLDFIFPLSYVMFWICLVTITFREWLPIESRWQMLSLIPVLAGIFDYLENVCVLLMLSKYPERDLLLAFIASTMTILKSAFTAISILLIASGVVAIIRKRLKGFFT